MAASFLIAVVIGLPAGWLAGRIVLRFSETPLGQLVPVVVVLATCVAFGWAALATPPGWVLAASLALAWCLICLAAVDLASFRLPDILTLPLLAAGLVVAFGLPGAPVLDHVLGAAAGWSVLACLAFAYQRWRGVAGIGGGDAKLLGAAGAWLGWRPLPSVLVIACALAFAWIAVRLALRGRAALRTRIAFGAPLSLAFWTVWLVGPLTL